MTDVPPSAKEIGRGAIWSSVNQTFSQLMVLAVFLITARFIPKEDFGTMAICLLIFEFFRQVSVESVATTLLSRQNPQDKDYNTGFVLANIGSVLGAVIMFALAVPLARVMDNPALEHGVQLTSVMLLSLGLSKIHEVWLMRQMKFKSLALRSFVAISIGGGVGIYMAVHGYGLSSLIAQQIIMSVLGALLLWWITKWRPSFSADWPDLRELFGFTRHVSANAMLGSISSNMDTFFTSYYLGATATGIYSSAKRLLLSIQLTTWSALNAVVLPVLSSASDDKKLRDFYYKSCMLTGVITVPLYLGLSVLSDDIVTVLLGYKWIEVAPVMSFLSIAALIISLDQYNGNVFLVKNKPHYKTWITFANLISNIIIVFIFARMGLLHLSIALMTKVIIMAPISTLISLRMIKGSVKEYAQLMVPSFLSALIMAASIKCATIFVVNFSSLMNILILIPSGFLIYLGCLYLIKKEQVSLIFQLCRSMISKN